MTWRRVMVALLVIAGAIWGYGVLGGGTPGPVELAGTGARYAIGVALDRARPGPVEIKITATTAKEPVTTAKEPVTPAAVAEVSVFAVMPHMGHITTEIPARRERPGRFVARGELFTMAGVWEIAVRVDGPSGTEVIRVNTLVGE
ncbi:FixH family protein [Streptosporangium sp. NBC_01469]|uniref:FixH family protein n=1 Tax=Streptosporangium sp. NBC_01469 TaxID=2903898 RepID=UPI002E2E5711|nr:FixH family protein [Streptosporangium sp. NBC_01469]